MQPDSIPGLAKMYADCCAVKVLITRFRLRNAPIPNNTFWRGRGGTQTTKRRKGPKVAVHVGLDFD